MSRPVSPVVCDGPGCGKQKQEANRWWLIGQHGAVMIVVAAGSEDFDARYIVFDFCGRECALKFISEQMGKVATK